MPETLDQFKFECSPEDAPKFWKWVHKRGGIAKWRSLDLSNPGKTWSTPVRDAEGNEITKPTWQTDSKPSDICTDPGQISVVTDKEVKRFRVAIRMGSQGLMIKLTDASSRKVRAMRDKLSEQHPGASYHFDYETQEAVFTIPDKIITLNEWAQQNPQLAEQALTES